MQKNPILFVSLGPGDPELITLKGLKALQQADIIFCPSTLLKEGKNFSRAADIMRGLDIPESKFSFFLIPMSKDRTKALHSYHEVYDSAVKLYHEQKQAVIVAEGDAGFYSSIHYIYDRMHAIGIPAQFIAGVPAFIACGALSGLHIVQQEEKLVVVPGMTTFNELDNFMQLGMTVVIMKVSQCIDELHRFMAANPSLHYYYFENVGTENEYYSTNIDDLKKKRFLYFSLMIIKS